MLDSLTAAIAANRFGLGARPGELAGIGSHGRDWLRAQLTGAPPAVSAPGLRSTAETLTRILELRAEIQRARKAQVGRGVLPPGQNELRELLRSTYEAEVSARFSHALGTERPFLERLTQLWANHFAVSTDKDVLAGVAGSFEREAIRPHVLGSFTDLLLAVEQHPAMLLYLDNAASSGPHSGAARAAERRGVQRKIGINENLARECLELHTLGVGGGYTQQDVTTFAWVLSGWSIGRLDPRHAEPVGSFLFRPRLHEPGAQTLLGKRYPDTGYAQGVAVLRDLATHPSTARFIATKLARHFVADDPPPALVTRVARAFRRSGGHLPTVYAALIDSPEAWKQPTAKYKTPSDHVLSTYRGLQLPAPHPRALLATFNTLGQRTWTPGSPAGWPDRSADWDGPSALLKRIEWANALGQKIGSERDALALAPQLLGRTLTPATREAIARAASASQAITLLLAAPEFIRR